MDCLFPSAQNDGIAGFNRQPGNLDGDVGPRLVDDADDSERIRALPELQAVGQNSFIEAFTDRIWQFGQLAQISDRPSSRFSVNVSRSINASLMPEDRAACNVGVIGLQNVRAGLIDQLGQCDAKLDFWIPVPAFAICRNAARAVRPISVNIKHPLCGFMIQNPRNYIRTVWQFRAKPSRCDVSLRRQNDIRGSIRSRPTNIGQSAQDPGCHN